jgi:Tfp pilus assembly pilus retraction ATPase PilT
MPVMNSLAQLQFADLYLGHPSLEHRLSRLPGAQVEALPQDAGLRQDIDRLLDACREARNGTPGANEFKLAHEDLHYRVAVMQTPHGAMFVLRRLAGQIGTLAELGVPAAWIRQLMAPDLTGLFIVSGAAKMGKTTTACALVQERLRAFGGVAVTTEGPVELPLEGAHGDGICYQTITARDTPSFIDSFRSATRWGARIILVHEIREAQVAAEVLQASLNGHLIISTMLGDDVVRTVSTLHMLAGRVLGSDTASALLADGLAGVLHQRLASAPTRRQLETEFLLLSGMETGKRMLRDGQFEHLRHAMRQQVGSLLMDSARSPTAA